MHILTGAKCVSTPNVSYTFQCGTGVSDSHGNRAPTSRTVRHVSVRCISPRPACLRARFDSATLRFMAACKLPYFSKNRTSPFRMACSIRTISRPISSSYSDGRGSEAGISLPKYLWDNDLATPCERRVSLGVSERRKSRYPLGLREKHAETERSGGSAGARSRAEDVA